MAGRGEFLLLERAPAMYGTRLREPYYTRETIFEKVTVTPPPPPGDLPGFVRVYRFESPIEPCRRLQFFNRALLPLR
jgi:hypothetical protein